jgi:diguanylate cyclase (GGDEF)-like protein
MRMGTDIVTSELDRQALADLLKRGKAGNYIYAIIWFVIATINYLQYTHQNLLYYNLALFLAVGTLRVVLGHLNADFTFRNYRGITHVLEVAVCAQSLHFGLLAAYIYHSPDLQPLVFPMISTASGMVAAGTATLGVNRRIRLWYPGLMIAPFFVSFIFHYSQMNFVLACISIIFFVYIYSSTGNVYADYWSSKINSAMLLEKTIELTARSVTDPLTKLHNRAYFNEHLEKEWKRAFRNQQSVAVMFVDIDHFKLINDKYGHATGDLCLIQTGEVLAKYGQRAGDAVARYGGEEFVLFFSDTDATGAASIADKIIADFRAMTVHTPEAVINLRCSIGIRCCRPDTAITQSSFLADADTAMYRAKKQGRDRFEIYGQGNERATEYPAPGAQPASPSLILAANRICKKAG